MDTLPDEIIYEILDNLKNLNDLKNYSGTNKRYNAIINDYLKNKLRKLLEKINNETAEGVINRLTDEEDIFSLQLLEQYYNSKDDEKMQELVVNSILYLIAKESSTDIEDENVSDFDNLSDGTDLIGFKKTLDFLKYEAIVKNDLNELSSIIRKYDNDFYLKVDQRIYIDEVDALYESIPVSEYDNLFYAAIRWGRKEILNWLLNHYKIDVNKLKPFEHEGYDDYIEHYIY